MSRDEITQGQISRGQISRGQITRGQWLWDHSGRLAGTILVLLAFAAMVFLAAIGFKPALYLVVLIVVGIAMIAVGGRIRGS